VYGFLNLDVAVNNGGAATLVGTFYSNDGSGGEMTDQFTITKSGAEGDTSLSSPPPDLPVEEETDVVEELDDDGVDDVGLDDAVVSEESEDVDTAAEDEEEGDDDGGGTDEGE
jgi:hypothetical protein